MNSARSGAGCAALTADATLGQLAQQHSQDMQAAGALSLLDPDGVSVLAQGARGAALAHSTADASAVVDGWLADPTDRATLLDCGMHTAGGGLATGGWWTLLLA